MTAVAQPWWHLGRPVNIRTRAVFPESMRSFWFRQAGTQSVQGVEKHEEVWAFPSVLVQVLGGFFAVEEPVA